jgi:hypothetical protein
MKNIHGGFNSQTWPLQKKSIGNFAFIGLLLAMITIFISGCISLDSGKMQMLDNETLHQNMSNISEVNAITVTYPVEDISQTTKNTGTSEQLVNTSVSKETDNYGSVQTAFPVG